MTGEWQSLCYLRYLQLDLEKKYIVRDSSALFDDKMHSPVFISAQETHSKSLCMSCQT